MKNQEPTQAVQILRELKMDHDTMTKVKVLVGWLRRPIGEGEAKIRRTMSQMTQELYDSLLLLKEAVAEEIPESPGKLTDIVSRDSAKGRLCWSENVGCHRQRFDRGRHEAGKRIGGNASKPFEPGFGTSRDEPERIAIEAA